MLKAAVGLMSYTESGCIGVVTWGKCTEEPVPFQKKVCLRNGKVPFLDYPPLHTKLDVGNFQFLENTFKLKTLYAGGG